MRLVQFEGLSGSRSISLDVLCMKPEGEREGGLCTIIRVRAYNISLAACVVLCLRHDVLYCCVYTA